MNESFKTDPSLATSARAAKESGSYLCASNVTPTAVRFIVSVFLCLLCSCRMSSTQMTCSHFRKNRPKKRQKPAGCRSRIISKNRPVPIFGRSTGASLIYIYIYIYMCIYIYMYIYIYRLHIYIHTHTHTHTLPCWRIIYWRNPPSNLLRNCSPDKSIIDYVYMDISHLFIYLILNKPILWLRCLHELLLE